MNKRGLLFAIIAALAFGIYPSTTKIANAEGANATFVILVTTLGRAASLALYCLLTKKTLIPKNRNWRPTIVGGFFQSVSILGVLGSLAYLPAPVTIIILFSHTIMLLGFLAIKREIVLTPYAVIASLLALLGISFVIGLWGHMTSLHPIGLLLAFVAALATMSRLYMYGKQTLEQEPAVVGAQIFTIAFCFSLLLLFFQSATPPTSLVGYLATLVSTISLSIGTFAMFYGIALLGSFQFSLMVKIEPVLVAVFAWLIAGEVLSSSQYLGMALVIVSLVSYQLFDARARDQSKLKSA